jgi:protein-histidine pros-kinase
LLSLINDLLDLAKIESGKVQVKFELVNGGVVIEDVAQSLRPLAEAKGLKLEVSIPQGATATLTDRRALSQILINLTNNAIKFTDVGVVLVQMSQSGLDGKPITEIQVRDTGIGIHPEDRGKLFQAFARVERNGRSQKEGSGLGLHLSQKLAQLLGGHIEVESEFGKGSTFKLIIGEGSK